MSRTVEFNLNKRLIEGFIYAGAFDCFGKTRSQLIAVYEKAMACAVKDSKSRILELNGEVERYKNSRNENFNSIKKYPKLELEDLEENFDGGMEEYYL